MHVSGKIIIAIACMFLVFLAIWYPSLNLPKVSEKEKPLHIRGIETLDGIHCNFDSKQTFDCTPLLHNGIRLTKDRVLKIVLMTKNEWPLSRSWVLYHGLVFGFNNIYVIDGSNDPRQIKYMVYLKSLGYNILFSQADLNSLEKVISKLMRSLRKSCDFLLKLDTDEFLAVYDPPSSKVYTSHIRIQAHLNSLPYNGSMYKVGYYSDVIPPLDNCLPEDDITSTTVLFSCPQRSTHKTFFPSKTFEHMDLGSHAGSVSVSGPGKNVYHTSNFLILHYHNQCFLSYVKNCETVIVSHGYVYQNDSIERRIEKLSAKNGQDYNSWHKAAYYLTYLKDPNGTEKSYIDSIRQSAEGTGSKCNITAVADIHNIIRN